MAQNPNNAVKLFVLCSDVAFEIVALTKYGRALLAPPFRKSLVSDEWLKKDRKQNFDFLQLLAEI